MNSLLEGLQFTCTRNDMTLHPARFLNLFLSLFRAGHVFLDVAIFLFAVNCLKGPAAS